MVVLSIPGDDKISYSHKLSFNVRCTIINHLTRSWIKKALARTTQMHIQIGIKKFRITIIYDFTKVVNVDIMIYVLKVYR